MLFVALKGEKVDGRDFIPQALAAGAAGVVEGLEELQSLAARYRQTLKAKVVAVTGSAGKTTTKELLRTFLSAAGTVHATEGNYNNHIGLPVTILNCPREADFLVVEMGTNHPGEIKALCDIAAPDIGVVTNIGTAHLEFFGTREAIAEEKGELLRSSAKGFSLKSDKYLPGNVESDLPWLKEALARVLPGAHNLANAALAFAVAESFGVTREQAVAALSSFELPGSRWRRTRKWGATFIDDTYNANPEAMIAALDAFADEPCEGRWIAVLGDMFELGEKSGELHRKVFAHAMTKGFHLVIGVGEESSKCICNLAYPKLDKLKRKFRVDVSAGDLVLLKASHSMKLGELLRDS
jgi:UDP-N-acetylmuramoyl-tripeptide--D-alanyl-D-alanine ligase